MIWMWIGFIVFVIFMLALDLGVFHRKSHVVSMKEALGWSAVWITIALLFTVFIYFGYENHWLGLGAVVDPIDGIANTGATAAVKYVTAYVVEKSLSVDNIFVIAMIFGFFAIPNRYQHRVLFWGILGALVMRGAMIAIGAQIIERYHWVLYVFGGFLILTAVKMLLMKTDHASPDQNIVVRLTRKFFPITQRLHGEHLVVRAGSAWSREAESPGAPLLPDAAVDAALPGTLMLTPLSLSLIVVEFTDLVFAVDSIPAVFAVTGDAFLVFTSNVFAILGLRSLYFALAGMMNKFRYLKVSLALVLALVGAKMLAAKWLKEAIGPSFNFWLLGAVLLILIGGVIASVLANRREERIAISTPVV